MKNATFAQRLAEAMALSGISAAELGVQSSISKSTMSQYRSGKYEPKHDRVVQLARILGCSPQWLAGEDVPMTEPEGSDASPGMIPVLGSFDMPDGNLMTAENIIGHQLAENMYCDGHHFYAFASGDSMEPIICDGDRLLCRRQDTIGEGQLGIFLLPDNASVIRRLEQRNGTQMLISFNCYYPPRRLEDFGSVRVIARLLHSTRKW